MYQRATGFNATVVCRSRYDYSNGDITVVRPPRFDVANDVSKCFIPQATPVASMAEPYAASTTAPCSGLIDNILVPFANRLNPNFTLVQPPGAVQTVMNTRLSTQLTQLPGFVPNKCFKALLRFQCSTIFPKPVRQTLLQALINSGVARVQALTIAGSPLGQALQLSSTSFSIPQFPPVTVCQEFSEQCKDLLPQLIAKNPAIAPNCSALVSGTTFGTRQFPNGNQTVSSVSMVTGLVNPPRLTFRFISGPNPAVYNNESQLAPLVTAYEPTCPKGFVIPEEPDHANNIDITGTACAMACM